MTKYIVENFDTCEPVAIFDSEEQRQAWLDTYVTVENGAGYTTDGVRVSIYEEG